MATTTGVLGALWFTGQSLRATNNQYALSQQVAVTDRFQKATEQLASDKLSVRLSGAYLLERLAKDSPDDHPTVFEVLSAYVRSNTNATECKPVPLGERTVAYRPAPEADVQAVLTVLGRRDAGRDSNGRLDLTRTCLASANFKGANLARVAFTDANLTGAILDRANLAGAIGAGVVLTGALVDSADLTDVGLINATLVNVILAHANLTRANLGGSNLTYAQLQSSNLTGADLDSVNLTGAALRDTYLTGANLTGADLTGADLTGADLTGADLMSIYYDATTRWPEGFTPPESRSDR